MPAKALFDEFVSAKLEAEISAENHLKEMVQHELQVCDDEARKAALNDFLALLESEF